MKRAAILLGLVSILAAPANAQNWNSQYSSHWNINKIQQSLQERIRIGSQSGRLTRSEVARLQSQYDRINDLERRLRRGGLSAAERNRLDDALDRLSSEIYKETRDGEFLGGRPWGWIHTPNYRPRGWDDRRWNSTHWDDSRWDGKRRDYGASIDRRQDNLDDRITAGRRDGSLTRKEAQRLRQQSNRIERLEDQRAADGRISAHDREKLDKHMDNLDRKIDKNRHD